MDPNSLNATQIWIVIIISLTIITSVAFLIYTLLAKKIHSKNVVPRRDKKIIDRYSFKNALLFSIISFFLSFLISIMIFLFSLNLNLEINEDQAFFVKLIIGLLTMILYYIILKITLEKIERKSDVFDKNKTCLMFFIYCLVFVVLINFFSTLLLHLFFTKSIPSYFFGSVFPSIGIGLVTLFLNMTYRTKEKKQ